MNVLSKSIFYIRMFITLKHENAFSCMDRFTVFMLSLSEENSLFGLHYSVNGFIFAEGSEIVS